MNNLIHLDFETRSKIDLLKSGAYKYAKDESTEILCIGYKINNGDRKIWTPFHDSPPLDLIEQINQGGIITCAHNAEFERLIWKYQCHKKRNWPAIPTNNFYCTAAHSAYLSLPRKLEKVAKIYDVEHQKDMEGNRLMLKLSKPRTHSKFDKRDFFDDPGDLLRLYDYCVEDVAAEEDVFVELQENPMPRAEYDLWLLDQKINERGIPLDKKAVTRGVEFADRYSHELTKELREITNGTIESANQVASIVQYLKIIGAQNLDKELENIDGLDQKIVQAQLDREDLADHPRRILEIRQALSKSSVKKLQSMLAMSDQDDDRIRGAFLYHGASTGRWCITGEHEVLTRKGWQQIQKWEEHDEIMIWEPQNKKLIFSQCEKNVFNCEEELLSFDQDKISLTCTAEHVFPTITSRGNLKEKTALHVAFGERSEIPLCGKYKNKFINKWKTRFLIMAQADGHYSDTKKGGRFLRFRFKKQRKIDRFLKIAKKLELEFSSYYNSDGTTNFVLRKNKIPKWIWDFFNKEFDASILKHSPKHFIEELSFWDGHKEQGRESFEYSTCSKNNAQWAVTMAHLNNMSARYVARNRHGWNINYRVYISPKTKTRINKLKISKTSFKGKVYCPTTYTGFFLVRHKGKISITGNSGKGIQPQNLTKAKINDQQIEQAFEFIKHDRYSSFRNMAGGNVFDLLSQLMRGFLCCDDGHSFIAGDFNAIEARVVFWLAGEQRGLSLFENDEDIYIDMAQDIYERSLNKNDNPTERQLGKQAVLGCGFGMGAPKFKMTCKSYGMNVSDEMSSKAVATYRKKYHRVRQLWYGLEEAAISAIENPTKSFTYGHITFFMSGKYLQMKLPSGRCLSYYGAETFESMSPFGIKKSIRFFGVNSQTKAWCAMTTYGGKLTENATQAVARDLLVHSMKELEKEQYPIVLHVHDEIVCELSLDDPRLDMAKFEAIMARKPAWATSIPIKVESWINKRFKK